MAAATLTAVYARMFGSNLQQAFAQVTSQASPQNLDLIQILDAGDDTNLVTPTVEINVDYTGAVHNPAVNPTNGTRIGAFLALNVPDGSSTATFFASAFANTSQQDILQCINLGGNISYWLDYLGVAHGA
jgi:hypothetical protein